MEVELDLWSSRPNDPVDHNLLSDVDCCDVPDVDEFILSCSSSGSDLGKSDLSSSVVDLHQLNLSLNMSLTHGLGLHSHQLGPVDQLHHQQQHQFNASGPLADSPHHQQVIANSQLPQSQSQHPQQHPRLHQHQPHQHSQQQQQQQLHQQRLTGHRLAQSPVDDDCCVDDLTGHHLLLESTPDQSGQQSQMAPSQQQQQVQFGRPNEPGSSQAYLFASPSANVVGPSQSGQQLVDPFQHHQSQPLLAVDQQPQVAASSGQLAVEPPKTFDTTASTTNQHQPATTVTSSGQLVSGPVSSSTGHQQQLHLLLSSQPQALPAEEHSSGNSGQQQQQQQQVAKPRPTNNRRRRASSPGTQPSKRAKSSQLVSSSGGPKRNAANADKSRQVAAGARANNRKGPATIKAKAEQAEQVKQQQEVADKGNGQISSSLVVVESQPQLLAANNKSAQLADQQQRHTVETTTSKLEDSSKSELFFKVNGGSSMSKQPQQQQTAAKGNKVAQPKSVPTQQQQQQQQPRPVQLGARPVKAEPAQSGGPSVSLSKLLAAPSLVGCSQAASSQSVAQTKAADGGNQKPVFGVNLSASSRQKLSSLSSCLIINQSSSNKSTGCSSTSSPVSSSCGSVSNSCSSSSSSASTSLAATSTTTTTMTGGNSTRPTYTLSSPFSSSSMSSMSSSSSSSSTSSSSSASSSPTMQLGNSNLALISNQDWKSAPSGQVVVLTDEERRTLIAEGYPIPQRFPLSKAEERSLKKIRRKIKNKISAQESRRKKKEYMEELEKKVHAMEMKIMELERENRLFRQRLQLEQHDDDSGCLADFKPSSVSGCLGTGEESNADQPSHHHHHNQHQQQLSISLSKPEPTPTPTPVKIKIELEPSRVLLMEQQRPQLQLFSTNKPLAGPAQQPPQPTQIDSQPPQQQQQLTCNLPPDNALEVQSQAQARPQNSPHSTDDDFFIDDILMSQERREQRKFARQRAAANNGYSSSSIDDDDDDDEDDDDDLVANLVGVVCESDPELARMADQIDDGSIVVIKSATGTIEDHLDDSQRSDTLKLVASS